MISLKISKSKSELSFKGLDSSCEAGIFLFVFLFFKLDNFLLLFFQRLIEGLLSNKCTCSYLGFFFFFSPPNHHIFKKQQNSINISSTLHFYFCCVDQHHNHKDSDQSLYFQNKISCPAVN